MFIRRPETRDRVKLVYSQYSAALSLDPFIVSQIDSVCFRSVVGFVYVVNSFVMYRTC